MLKENDPLYCIGDGLSPIRESIFTAERLVSISFSGCRRKQQGPKMTGIGGQEPVRTGAKKDWPTGSAAELETLQARLESLKEALDVPRIRCRNQLSEGVWLNDLKLARIVKPCGKQWDTMGHLHPDTNDLFLFPEEALFLIETNSLELTYGGVPMSVQQAYHLMLGPHFPLDNYAVYTDMARLGYKVVRHRPQLVGSQCDGNAKQPSKPAGRKETVVVDLLDENETVVGKPCVDKSGCGWLRDLEPSSSGQQKDTSNRSKKKSNKQSCRIAVGQIVSDVVGKAFNDAFIKNDDVESTANGVESSCSSERGSKLMDFEITLDDTADEVDKSLDGVGDVTIVSSGQKDGSDIWPMIPNCYKRTRMTLPAPPKELLPFRSWPSKNVYSVVVRKSGNGNKRGGRPHQNDDVDETMKDNDDVTVVDEVNFPALGQAGKNNSRLPSKGRRKRRFSQPNRRKRRWQTGRDTRQEGEVLRLHENHDEDEDSDDVAVLSDEMDSENVSQVPECLKDGPLERLWKGKTNPLMRPMYATTTKRIMSRMNLGLHPNLVAAESRFPLCFDVYLPTVHFRKSKPIIPNYRVVVCRLQDVTKCCPGLKDVLSISSGCNDQVPVLIAARSHGSVSYHCFSPISLTT